MCKIYSTIIALLGALSLLIAQPVLANYQYEAEHNYSQDEAIIIGQIDPLLQQSVAQALSQLTSPRRILFFNTLDVQALGYTPVTTTPGGATIIKPTTLLRHTFQADKDKWVVLGDADQAFLDQLKHALASLGLEVSIEPAQVIKSGLSFTQPNSALNAEAPLDEDTFRRCFGHTYGVGTVKKSSDGEGDKVAARIRASDDWKKQATVSAKRGGYYGKLDFSVPLQLVSCSSSELLREVSCKVRGEVCALEALCQ